MNQNDQDKEIQNAMNAAPLGNEPPEDLMRNLRTLAKATPVRHAWRINRLLPVAGIAVLAVVVVSMLPSKASAKTYDMLVAAAQKVNAFQFTIESSEHGKKEEFSIAGRDGKVYMNTGEGSVMRIEGDAMSFYDQKENKIVRMKLGGLVDPAFIAKEIQGGMDEAFKNMNLKQMLEEYGKKYGKDKIHISPRRYEGVKEVYDVTLEATSQPERVSITVDSATDLPQVLEVETRDDKGNFRHEVTMRMRFGNEVDDSALKADFPKDAKVEEIDLSNVVGDAMKGMGTAFEQAAKEAEAKKK